MAAPTTAGRDGVEASDMKKPDRQKMLAEACKALTAFGTNDPPEGWFTRREICELSGMTRHQFQDRARKLGWKRKQFGQKHYYSNQ